MTDRAIAPIADLLAEAQREFMRGVEEAAARYARFKNNLTLFGMDMCHPYADIAMRRVTYAADWQFELYKSDCGRAWPAIKDMRMDEKDLKNLPSYVQSGAADVKINAAELTVGGQTVSLDEGVTIHPPAVDYAELFRQELRNWTESAARRLAEASFVQKRLSLGFTQKRVTRNRLMSSAAAVAYAVTA